MLFDPFQEVQLGVLQCRFSVTLASEGCFLPVFVSFHICFPALRDSSASSHHSSFSSSAFPSLILASSSPKDRGAGLLKSRLPYQQTRSLEMGKKDICPCDSRG